MKTPFVKALLLTLGLLVLAAAPALLLLPHDKEDRAAIDTHPALLATR